MVKVLPYFFFDFLTVTLLLLVKFFRPLAIIFAAIAGAIVDFIPLIILLASSTDSSASLPLYFANFERLYA